MILKPGANDFLAVIEIFGSDEADHTVDEQRVEGARDAVSTRLTGLLIDPAMRVGRERRALPGLEIHQVVADGAAPKRLARRLGLPQESKIDAETSIGRLRSRNRLKDEIDRDALRYQSERRRDMRQDASLGRNLQSGDDLVEQR